MKGDILAREQVTESECPLEQSGPQPWAGSLSLSLGKGGRGHEDRLTSTLMLVPSYPCSRMAVFGPQGPPQMGSLVTKEQSRRHGGRLTKK